VAAQLVAFRAVLSSTQLVSYYYLNGICIYCSETVKNAEHVNRYGAKANLHVSNEINATV
jgi:hypothetical protein